MRKERVSHEADGTNVLPKERAKSAPPMQGRHEKFQLGTNPMNMTEFEKKLVKKEVDERDDARKKYIYGIQGRDGGCFPDSQTPEESTIPFNIKRTY